MELKKIEYFLRIVDEGSLSKAAQSLYLTQPTLSRFLEKLESEAGVALFTRNQNSSLTLTEAGKAYLKTARKIAPLWNSLDAELARSRRQRDHIVFGIYGDYLSPFGSACANAVMERYPEISVSFLCHNSFEIQKAIAEGNIHMGMCTYKSKDPRLTYIPCHKYEMNLVVAKDHPLAAHSYQLPGQENHRIRLDQLDPDSRFALMSDHTVLRETVEQYLKKMEFTPNVKQTYMRHGSIVSIVNTDKRLIAFCPSNNVSKHLAYVALDPPFYYHHGICYPKKAVLSPPEKLLISLMQKGPQQRDLD